MVKAYTYTIEVSDKTFFDKLKEETGLSDANLMDEAFSLYRWAVDKSKEGYMIAAINDVEGKKVLLKGSEALENLLKESYKGREENVEADTLSLDEMLQLAGKIGTWDVMGEEKKPLYIGLIESMTVRISKPSSQKAHKISVKYGSISLGKYSGKDQRLKKLYENVGLKRKQERSDKAKAALIHAKNLLKEGGEKR